MSLLPTPRQFAVDQNGAPMAGAKLYFYASGTSAPKTVYADAGLSTAHPQPVVADAAGLWPAIYLGAGDYKVEQRSAADILVWTQDTVTGISSQQVRVVSTIAELRALRSGQAGAYGQVQALGYYAAGDGGGGLFVWDGASTAADDGGTVIRPSISPTTGRWLRVKAGAINVLWFGAKGDGATDDTAAINAARAVSVSAGRALYLPPLRYLVKDGAHAGRTADGERAALLISGAADLHIIAHGATLLVDGANRSQYAHAILVDDCTGPVVIDGLTIDYKRPPIAQGVCTAVTATTADFALDTTAYPAPTWTDVQRVVEFWPDDQISAVPLERPSGTYDAGRAFALVSGTTYRLTKSAGDAALTGLFTVGRKYALVHQVYGADAVQVTDSASIHLRGCTIRTAAGMALYGLRVDDVEVTDTDVAPATETGKLLSVTADGIHLKNTRHPVRITGNEIVGTGDDAINIGSAINFVHATGTSTSFTLGLSYPYSPPSAGELLQAKSLTGTVYDLGRVVTATGAGSGLWSITLDTALPGGFAVNWQIWSVTESGRGVVADNEIRRCLGWGAQARGLDLDIRDNSIRNMLRGGVGVVVLATGFYEGGALLRVSIEDNAIDQAPIARAAVDSGTAASVWVSVAAPSGGLAPAGGASDVSVTGNDISRSSNGGILCEAVDGLVVADNVFSDIALNPDTSNWSGMGDAAIGLNTCSDVAVTGNAYRNGGAGKIEALNVTGAFRMAGNENFTYSGSATTATLAPGVTVADGVVSATGLRTSDLRSSSGDLTVLPASDLTKFGGAVRVAAGGLSAGAGGSLELGLGQYIAYSPMAVLKGSLSNVAGTECQGGAVLQTRPVGGAGQALADTLGVGADGSVTFPRVGTTAAAANAYLDAGNGNRLLRSTSSARYKTGVEDMDAARADAFVQQARPVWYRSTAPADRPDWSWYGLIAEELAEIDPRLVFWAYPDDAYDEVVVERAVEMVADDGSVVVEAMQETVRTLKPGAKLVPDGVQYDRLTVLLLSVVQRLEARVKALEDAR